MSLGAIEERTFHYKTNSFYKTEICKITIFYFYIYIFFYHQYSNFNTFTNYTYGRIHEVMQQKHTVFTNICLGGGGGGGGGVITVQHSSSQYVKESISPFWCKNKQPL